MADDRATRTQRGYSNRWLRAAKTFLARNPLCRYCEQLGRTTPAEVVDHITPHRGDSRLFWDSANWQPLCKPCHDRTKQREERRGIQDGCTADGMPRDTRHHWHPESGRGGKNLNPDLPGTGALNPRAKTREIIGGGVR